MDSITHALFVAVICALLGRPDLAPYAALGAVVPDVDVIFNRFSSHDPRLYIFTHGGFTHSVAGSLLVAAVAVLPAVIVFAGGVPAAAAIAVALGGALSHVALDYLAYPGIPLLFPLTDRKFTLGIATGPSMFLTVASLVYGALVLAGAASIGERLAYAGFFGAVIAASLALKAYVTATAGGTAIPGLSPLRWLVVAETPLAYHVYRYDLLKGRSKGNAYDKLRGLSAGEAQKHDALPEMRRLRYHSYLLVAERDGPRIRYYDPLREGGYIWYPPYFKSLVVQDGAGDAGRYHLVSP